MSHIFCFFFSLCFIKCIATLYWVAWNYMHCFQAFVQRICVKWLWFLLLGVKMLKQFKKWVGQKETHCLLPALYLQYTTTYFPSILRERGQSTCHTDSSVRLCLSVSWFAWELRWLELKARFFQFFFFPFLLVHFGVLFCAYIYVNFIECCSVSYCMFSVWAVKWFQRITAHLYLWDQQSQ